MFQSVLLTINIKDTKTHNNAAGNRAVSENKSDSSLGLKQYVSLWKQSPPAQIKTQVHKMREDNWG